MSRPPLRLVRTVAVFALTALAAPIVPFASNAISSAAGLPTADSSSEFYVPPATLHGRPGDVVKSREVAAPAFPEASVRQLMYLSSDVDGDPIPVSGALLVPRTPSSGIRPLVVIAPGTRGLGDQCAPSRQFGAATLDPRAMDYEVSTAHELLLNGFAVVVTDYEGHGTPGLPTYLVGRTEGQAALDALRAAQRIDLSDAVMPESPVGIAGYSQGGQAAAWAAELAPGYAPELNLAGVLAGGVPSDLNVNINHANGNVTGGAGFALAAISGLDTAYPELRLDEHLTPEGADIIERVRSGCTGEYVTTYGDTGASDITEPDVLSLPEWQARLAESKLGSRAPAVPTYLYHGTADTVVPFGLGQRLFHDWCSRGASVVFEAVPGAEHVSGIFAGPPRGLQWLAARLAGTPATEGCRVVR